MRASIRQDSGGREGQRTTEVRRRKGARRWLPAALALALAGAGLLGARPAAACLMVEANDYVAPKRAEQLLVAARDALKAGKLPVANRLAKRVTAADGPRAATQAEAWAVLGWIDWQYGQRNAAMQAFRRAKHLGKGTQAIDRVLADATESVALADLKKALAA